ncbi:hypothetical protein ACLOJK_019130 [Asimina triloba]
MIEMNIIKQINGICKYRAAKIQRSKQASISSNSKITNLDSSRKRIQDGQLGRKISTIQEDGSRFFCSALPHQNPTAIDHGEDTHISSSSILVSVRLVTPSSNDEQRTEPTNLNR